MVIAQVQVTGIPNPVQVTKGLTDQIWQMPLNYFAVGGMVLFGIGCVVLFTIILRWAAAQQQKVENAQKTATAYEILSKEVRDDVADLKETTISGINDLKETVSKIWDEILKMSTRTRRGPP